MRDTHSRPSAPNYTNACIVMFAVNLTWILMMIWAIWGLIAALGLTWVVNRAIRWIDTARQG